jgi:hypothetical protein
MSRLRAISHRERRKPRANLAGVHGCGEGIVYRLDDGKS